MIKKKSLTIDDRNGAFPGMLESRKFNIILVNSNKAGGENLVTPADKVIPYTGGKVIVRL